MTSPDWKQSKIGIDREGFLARLQALIDQSGPPPLGASGQMGPELPLSMSPVPESAPHGSMPDLGGLDMDAILQYLMDMQPLNEGGPPSTPIGPSGAAPMDPGQSSFLEALMSDYPIELFNTSPDAPPIGEAPLLPTGDPDILPQRTPGMQDTSDPAVNQFRNRQRYTQFPLLIELLNQGLQSQGQPPIEWGTTPEAAGSSGLRDFMESQNRTPQHIQNTIRSKTRQNQGQIDRLNPQVRGMMAPDAASQIAENPRGQLTPWLQSILGRRANFDPADPLGMANLGELRTDQINGLISGGPDRSSLVDPAMLSGPEAALARQLGGIENLVTEYPDVLGRNPEVIDITPEMRAQNRQGTIRALEATGNAANDLGNPGASQYLLPEAGLSDTQGGFLDFLRNAPPDQRGGFAVSGHAGTPPIPPGTPDAEGIAGLNRGAFETLLANLPVDEGGPDVPPDPRVRAGVPPMDFIGELMNMLQAQDTPPNPDADLALPERLPERGPGDYRVRDTGGVGMQAEANRSRSLWAPQAEPGTRLDAEVAPEAAARFGESFSGPDMLEQRSGATLGLDEAGNIRSGGPAGEIISGTMLEKILGNAGKVGKGLGGAALNVAPNLLDMYSASGFSDAIAGANQEYGGVMAPDSQGNMTPVPLNPGMAALYSMVPMLFDRRRFADDPQYRRQMIGPENIPELA